MILGIGIDSVEINRFTNWSMFSRKQLERIFSQEEIDYALSVSVKSAERFAVRFAAREAFFKAFHSAFPDLTVPFFFLSRCIEIKKNGNGLPYLVIDWNSIIQKTNQKNNSINVRISLTHTKVVATAFVVLQKAC